MVARILGLDAVPKPADAADALALAICHAWRTGGVAGAAVLDAAAPPAEGRRSRPPSGRGSPPSVPRPCRGRPVG